MSAFHARANLGWSTVFDVFRLEGENVHDDKSYIVWRVFKTVELQWFSSIRDRQLRGSETR